MKNKVLSVLLAICFMLSSLTISTFAEEINNTDDSIQMETPLAIRPIIRNLNLFFLITSLLFIPCILQNYFLHFILLKVI